MFNNPKILAIAFLGGLIPSLLWLWFWVKDEEKKPESKGLLTLIFIMGMLAVVVVLPVEKFIQAHVAGGNMRLVLWAAAEEIIKFLAVLLVLRRSIRVSQPIEWPIYLLTAALGFAALENALFLVKPLSLGNAVVGIITGELRYLGATLLHTISSGIVGISLGLSMHLSRSAKKVYVFFGLAAAVALHSAFNFFIMKDQGGGFLKICAFLWIASVIVMLVYEKLRRMN